MGWKKIIELSKFTKRDENGIETVPCNCWFDFQDFWGFSSDFLVTLRVLLSMQTLIIFKKLAVFGSFQSFPYPKL